MSEKLFITRKRKKWKFHHFNEWPNCWQADEITSQKILEFVDGRKLTIELGAGTAELALELARRYPDECFIACDIKSDRLYTGAKKALIEKLDNIRFLRINMRQLTDVFPVHCVSTIWVTFPDPFPRKKHAKHRLTHPHFLNTYKELLKSGGKLIFKTDNVKLFDWSVEQVENSKWLINEVARDLHASQLPDDYKIQTTYEKRFINENKPTHLLEAQIAKKPQTL